MKTKSKISLFSVVLILVVVALVLYYVMYFAPAQTGRNQLNAEVALNNAQAALCGAYLADHTPLEEGIAAVEAEIADLRENAFTNERSVNLVVSKAIQEYKVELTAMTVDAATTMNDNAALPIHLTFTGKVDDVLNFIAFFENNTDGSYLINGATMKVVDDEANATVTMYLCTPAV